MTKTFEKDYLKYTLNLYGVYAPYDRHDIKSDIFETNIKNVYIGRHREKCQIVLDDPTLLNVHASLQLINGYLILNNFKTGKKSIISLNEEFCIGATPIVFMSKRNCTKTFTYCFLPPIPTQYELEREEENKLDSQRVICWYNNCQVFYKQVKKLYTKGAA